MSFNDDQFSRTLPICPPAQFPFPFSPYPIQSQFMTDLFNVIENRRIGIFESPTGTGKSLSLMCGTLRWLLDHETAEREQLVKEIREISDRISKDEADCGGFDWLESQSEIIGLKKRLNDCRRLEDSMRKAETEVRLRKERVKSLDARIRSKNWPKKSSNNVENCNTLNIDSNEIRDGNNDDTGGDEQFALDDDDEYEQEDELIRDDYLLDKEPYSSNVQIFFCSRTHSQLSQVVNEVRNTIYGENIRIATLASRQNYCINPDVRKLNSVALINERCLELQRGSSSKATKTNDGCVVKKQKNNNTADKKCSCYVPNKIESTRDVILTRVLDIEELVKVATETSACPYYAARLAAKDAQIVMLSYQMLLHRRTRLQNGLDLRGSIVIIDEGHNLIDTISNIYSNEVSLNQLRQAAQQLVAYKKRYFSRFSTRNLLHLNQLIFITTRLVKMLETPPESKGMPITSKMFFPLDLMTESDIFTIRINEILEFCERTRLAQKVHGFSLKYDFVVVVPDQPQKPSRADYLRRLSQKMTTKGKAKEEVQPEVKESPTITSTLNKNTSSAIRPLLAFLYSLIEIHGDGRVLLTYSQGLRSRSSMKYLVLNPAGHFTDVLSECRAVIVAGGTMQPTAELKSQLFGGQLDRVQEFFFDHVVAKTSIMPIVVSRGPTSVPFIFNYANRRNPDLFKDLQRTLCNVCNVTPAGVVCFFGSYDYMDSFCTFLGTNSPEGLNTVSGKTLFREPRASNLVDNMLTDYAVAAKRQPKGAILLSVVGGKLSEGLNFSDDLGRCVIVVGLPFANKDSPELVEKMRFLDRTLGDGAGAEYYENICMKAVNQCIGRAVRHINDYAAVILLDQRYASKKEKLPLWISRSLLIASSFGICQSWLAKFFREKRNKVDDKKIL